MKFYLRLSMFMIIPLFLTFIVNAMCAFFYWTEQLDVIVNNINHEFVFWSCLSGAICVSCIICAQLMMSPYIDNIKKYNEEYDKCIQEQQLLKELQNKYLKLINETKK